MSGFSQNGWQPPTPQELRQDLEDFLKVNVPNYTARPADILSNLMDGGTAFGMWFVLQLQSFFNGYAPSYGDDFSFELRASEQGLRKKSSYGSVVDVQFTAPPYTIIPESTPITGNGLPTFVTLETITIGTSGSIITQAYCDTKQIPEIGIGQLNQLGISLENVAVTNTSTPTQPQEDESMGDFVKRCQLAWSSARGGSVSYLLTKLLEIEGVVQRAVKVQVNGDGTYEVLIDGGDPLDIAWAMFNGGGILPNVFVSNPSQSQTSRTITQDLILNTQSIPYKFTRPLQVNISLNVSLPLKGITLNNTGVTQSTQEAMENFINSTTIGEPINQIALQNAFINAFVASGAEATNVRATNITFTINNITGGGSTPITFDSEGYLQLQPDWYLTLSQYSVTLNA